MILGGFQPLTLSDFPGRTACVAFTQGCNLRCGYCHNPQLIGHKTAGNTKTPTEDELFAFLKRRQGVLDGVVVSGGEPTLQPDLLSFLSRIKQLGFLVKLDTNGTNPDVLQAALSQNLLDYVAMDVKHDPARYAEITGTPIALSVLAASRDALLSSGIAHEFRTTFVPHFHDADTIEKIARFCGRQSSFVLQSFRPATVLNPVFCTYDPPTHDQLQQFTHIAEQWVGRVKMIETDNSPKNRLQSESVLL